MTWETAPDRRTVVLTGIVTIAGAGTLAACGGGGDTSSTSVSAGAAPATSTSPAPATSASASAGGSSGGTAIVKLADVPVGGAVSAQAPTGQVIVAQPAAGQVVAFSAICPHAGCKVAPSGSQLVCPCHGSRFEVATGKVLNGPAKVDLKSVPVKVQGQDVVAG
ncbi:MAG TPA: Rieske (2Fe-2S) protein [Kineosporiaceae bacterium]|jgi:nitrite reductase/ring-hydroxylating ferredoxin subunit|nr:Rieske (2Fe-2S) protein [Kineosporiaceae bacterium]